VGGGSGDDLGKDDRSLLLNERPKSLLLNFESSVCNPAGGGGVELVVVLSSDEAGDDALG
jgi:hypothetical protein